MTQAYELNGKSYHEDCLSEEEQGRAIPVTFTEKKAAGTVCEGCGKSFGEGRDDEGIAHLDDPEEQP